jgi:hypothetical protein
VPKTRLEVGTEKGGRSLWTSHLVQKTAAGHSQRNAPRAACTCYILCLREAITGRWNRASRTYSPCELTKRHHKRSFFDRQQQPSKQNPFQRYC